MERAGRRMVMGMLATALLSAGSSAWAQVAAAPAVAASAATVFNGADTAWMLISTVLVMLMTMPGIMLFYGGMLRSKNALSIVAHTVAGASVITVLWAMFGYSIAFTSGGPWFGDMSRMFAEGLIGSKVGAHVSAPTLPEPVFFLFQLSFAIITFALVLGATAERMRLGVTIAFAALWSLLVYAPIAHWIWHPNGWLAKMGHMDFAGGTVVHIASGVTGLVAAVVLGPRRGFGKEPMVPHNLMLTVLGAGLLWAGWFGFNAGSAFEAGPRAAGALLATQVAACAGAMLWGFCEYIRRGQWSVLGMMTGAIAGLIAVTPASGYVGINGALCIGSLAGVVCFFAVVYFKSITGIDDALDVFALHGIGGLVGTVLTPVFALTAVAPVTATVWTNTLGALAVMAYAGVATWIILKALSLVTRLRVGAAQENVGLDISEHGEMLAPTASPQA
ncbi:ammonium transporter [Rhizobacter sp. J219]|uniref:ammonium transporter n=1 Tax=Rhizobacter sp. J219 TaxID=2898430 RepID=UPI0021514B86|nr:ammonium transporter [Rhizobacter sp. J219]MCR5883173.1 ammonium transporter [Rhizobacter sp. J219]